MAQASTQSAVQQGPKRQSPYWLGSAVTAVVFGLFILYSLWEVFFHSVGQYQNYISPYFSPPLGQWMGIRVLPALFVAWVPLFFRATCYYYRREYYRAFFWDPGACAVAERRRRPYLGETRFPLNINNLHRYFWYLAVIVLVFLWIDTVKAFIFPNGFGVGVGSLIMLINTGLLTFYTFSCHAFRHLVGGSRDCFSCKGHATTSYTLWNKVSQWNQRHGTWAWASLFSVWGADLYIRLLIMGVIHDVRFF